MDNLPNNSSPERLSLQLDPYYSPNNPNLITETDLHHLLSGYNREICNTVSSILPPIDVIQREFGNKLVAECNEKHRELVADQDAEIQRIKSTIQKLDDENSTLRKEQWVTKKADRQKSLHLQQLESRVQTLALQKSELESRHAVLKNRLIHAELHQEEQTEPKGIPNPDVQYQEQRVVKLQANLESLQNHNNSLEMLVFAKTNLAKDLRHDVQQKTARLEEVSNIWGEKEEALRNERKVRQDLNKSVELLKSKNDKLGGKLKDKQESIDYCKDEVAKIKKDLAAMRERNVSFNSGSDEKVKEMEAYIHQKEQDLSKQKATLENCITNGSVSILGSKKKKLE